MTAASWPLHARSAVLAPNHGTRLVVWTTHAFLAVAPFLYFAQVLLWRNDFVPIPYLLLLLAYLVATWARNHVDPMYTTSVSFLDLLVGYMVGMNIAWTAFEAFTLGPVNALRVLTYFVTPGLIYFYVSRRFEFRDSERALKILAWTAVAVAAELAYERYWNLVLFEPAPFQVRNLGYVAVLGSGDELLQLATVGYRSPGMLEHLHATAVFIGLGAVIWTSWYLARGKVQNLVMAILMLSALVLTGARTVLASAIAALVILGFGGVFARGGKVGKRLLVPLVLMGTAAGYLMFFSPLVSEIYAPLLTGEPLGHVSFWGVIVPEEIGIWAQQMRDLPLAIPFGLGPAPDSWRNSLGISSDDFFVIDMVSRYGIIGATVFYLLVPAMLIGTLRRLRVSGTEPEKMMFIQCAAMAFLLMGTTIHSGAIMRKSVFPWLFVFLGIARSLTVRGVVRPSAARGGEGA